MRRSARMAVVVRGGVLLDLSAGEIPRARALIDEARARGPLRHVSGAIELHPDGRANYALCAGWLELGRVLQAVGLAASVSVTTSLAWSWMFYAALPAGGAVGVAWATALIVRDRRRLHRQARELLRSLPSLVRA